MLSYDLLTIVIINSYEMFTVCPALARLAVALSHEVLTTKQINIFILCPLFLLLLLVIQVSLTTVVMLKIEPKAFVCTERLLQPFLIFQFETEYCKVAQDGLQLMIFLS